MTDWANALEALSRTLSSIDPHQELDMSPLTSSHPLKAPSRRQLAHLDENLGAIEVQLTLADRQEIETALAKFKVHGGRMGEQYLRDVDQGK